MIKRIKEIIIETSWVLSEIVGYDIDLEMALARLASAIDDLEASNSPTDDQIEIIFVALSDIQHTLLSCSGRVPKQLRNIVENLTDRIDIFLFHHRMF
jgi:hypothetical protein